MTYPPHPAAAARVHDPARLAALRRTGLLDAEASETFDRLTRLAKQVIGAPIALVSLVDEQRQFFLSQQGLGGSVADARETPLSHSFCQHVVATDDALVVDDARAHPVVCDNLAIPDLGVEAYLGVPIHAPDGEVLGSLCSIDNTPRAWTQEEVAAIEALVASVEAEIALRQEVAERERTERELRGVLGGLSDTVFRTDASGRLIFLNEAWERRTGRAVSEAIGRPLGEVLTAPGETLDALLTASEPPASVRVTAAHADGSAVHFDLRCRPMPADEGGLAGTLVDVTDAVHLSDERAAREAAEAARAEAERMARLQRAFLANMSHELRTPLTAILGCAEILNEEVSGGATDLVEPILTGGQRLMDTLNGILDLAQLDAGRVALKPRTLDVGAYLRDTARLLAPLADERGLDLHVESDAGCAAVRVAPSVLDRVVLNLVGNAIKFTERGQVAVRAALHLAPDDALPEDALPEDAASEDAAPDDAQLQIDVVDSGIGIPADALPHIFDAFQQASDGDSRTHEGTGLGLSITRRYVELAGGRLAIASEVGRGTHIRVTLPVAAG
ncbi:MAG: ATP-binding protein [Bacteroidota bacterium]